MAVLTTAQVVANYNALMSASATDPVTIAKAATFNAQMAAGSGLHATMEAVADVIAALPAETSWASLLASYNALLSGLATNPTIQAHAAAFNLAWAQTNNLRAALVAVQAAGG